MEKHLEADEKFWECEALSRVDLGHNRILTIPISIASVRSLLHPSLTHLHTNIIKQSQLKDSLFHLNLNTNNITDISALSTLTNLKFLDVSNNALSSCPDLSELNSLVTLKLSHNKLTKLSSNLPDTIEILDVSENRLETLPSPLPKRLLRLFAKDNALRNLLPSIFTSTQRLEELVLDKNRIGPKLPNSLPKSLKRLEVRMNMLESLEFVPDSIEELFADHNSIRKISASIWNLCPSLVTLSVSNNKIVDLGLVRSSSSCKIKLLDIRNNNLSSLSPYLGTMEPLKRILLEGNPLRTLRRSLVRCICPSLDFFSQTNLRQ